MKEARKRELPMNRKIIHFRFFQKNASKIRRKKRIACYVG